MTRKSRRELERALDGLAGEVGTDSPPVDARDGVTAPFITFASDTDGDGTGDDTPYFIAFTEHSDDGGGDT